MYMSLSKLWEIVKDRDACHGVAKSRTWLMDWTKTAVGFEGETEEFVCPSIYLVDATAAKSLQSRPTLQPHRRQPTRLPGPWDSPGKNTGVGCHFLLQCMKVKSESEVAQSCPTLRDSMDCSLPGSSVQGIFQAIVLEWVAISFSNACMHARSLHAVDGTLSNLSIGAQCWFECEYLFVEHFNIKSGFLVVVLFPMLLSTDSFRVFFLFFVQ